MNANRLSKEIDSSEYRYFGLMFILIACGLILAARLCYLFLADPERFPIATVKVAASYEHVSHKELENVLSNYLNTSFFSLPVTRLQNELNNIGWIDSAYVERVWPDTLKIKIVEKKPVAYWGNALMTGDGKLFEQGKSAAETQLPRLKGPDLQQLEVLQVYQKLSKILSEYGVNAIGLHLRDNHSWVLLLNDSVKIYLGKKELEARLLRFCQAYPAVFAEKTDQLASVDLRYPRGMAVQWKQQTGR